MRVGRSRWRLARGAGGATRAGAEKRRGELPAAAVGCGERGRRGRKLGFGCIQVLSLYVQILNIRRWEIFFFRKL